jgi:hypothetical protein
MEDLLVCSKQIPESVLTMRERFFARVNVAGNCDCWAFGKYAGYGRFMGYAAHRVSYAMHFGQIPDGMVIGHKCDNPKCVNPEHLEAITCGQNNRDARLRGLVKKIERGEQRYNHQLTEAMVLRIVDLHSAGLGRVRIAREIGATIKQVQKVLEGRTWTHITGWAHKYKSPSVPYVTVSSRRNRTSTRKV